jgi:predicted DCC family thiol-disulfide oxidoreductase YuxK
MSTERPLVFYDGGCPLCRREIEHYRRLDRRERIQWIDIVAEPERLASFGLTREQAMRRLHLQEVDGRWRVGAEAFIGLWSRLPGYRWLARLSALPGVRQFLGWSYDRFARWRWRRRGTGSGCDDSRCA